jgi:hypothetical protein
MESLCNLGLKTGKQLKEEGIDFGRTKIHPYIFFRAPYISREIDYSTPETEIFSSYGENQIGNEQRVYIRVDPDKTYVFSSEVRVRIPNVQFHNDDGHLINNKKSSRTHSDNIMTFKDERYEELYRGYYNTEIEKSKKTLSEYLSIIKENETSPYKVYNLHSSKKVYITKTVYPYDDKPIERNSEILVSLPHLTPEYFVLCT